MENRKYFVIFLELRIAVLAANMFQHWQQVPLDSLLIISQNRTEDIFSMDLQKKKNRLCGRRKFMSPSMCAQGFHGSLTELESIFCLLKALNFTNFTEKYLKEVLEFLGQIKYKIVLKSILYLHMNTVKGNNMHTNGFMAIQHLP